MPILEGDSEDLTPWYRFEMSHSDFMDLHATVDRVIAALYAMNASNLSIKPYVTEPRKDAEMLEKSMDLIDANRKNIDAPRPAMGNWTLFVNDPEAEKSEWQVPDSPTTTAPAGYLMAEYGRCTESELKNLTHNVPRGREYRLVYEYPSGGAKLIRTFII